MQAEQVMFRDVYVHTYVLTINENRCHGFERDEDGCMGGF